MSPISQFTVLAFASTALAIPGYRDFGHKHQYGHKHGHHGGSWGPSAPAGTGSGMPFPYPVANATGIYGSTGFGSGTAAPTAYSSSSAVSSSSVSTPAGPATVTVSPVPYSYSAPASSSSVDDAASTTECTTDVTITTTEKTYVTVTATAESSSSVEVSATQESSSSSSVRTTYTITKHSTVTYTPPSSSSVESTSASVSSSSSEVAPVTTSSSSSVAAYTPPVSSSSSSSSAEVSPVTTSESSSSSAPVLPSTYSEAQKAPAPSAYSSAAPSSTSATSSSASAAPSSYSGSGKRGIAYNVTDNANVMIGAASGSQVSWAYNWLSSDAGINSGVQFIPTMHAPEAPFSSWWTDDANSAISNGADLLFSFNEPDQSGLQPSDVANDWNTYMAPFNGKAKMCAPSVTNGGGSMGLTWLSSFLGYCSDCQIDCVNIHWYNPISSTSAQDFKDQVTNAINIKNTGDMPVYVTEFGLDGASDSDIASFLEDVMPWMDSNPNVHGYSYFMAYESLLLSGSSVSSPVGTTFMSYTG